MKVSLNWLRELVDAPLDGAEVAQRLTMAGLEIEGRAPFAQFSGVIVAQVRGKRPHPNATKLTLVDVWDGREVTQVVCGASNVPEPGSSHDLVLWARPGAKLPSGMTLQPKEVRGVVSPGMLCAEDELGLSTSHEGIITLSAADGLAPGDDVAQKLGLPDEILEVNVTPNRPDCLGHIGVARELAALLGCALKLPTVSLPASGAPAAATVTLQDPEGCPRYSARVLEGVTVRPSPFGVRLRLQALGVRAISNVVDATNWVMLERGQPLHAFDLDRVKGQAIVVRRAKPGEKIRTLDEQERTLEADEVAICDSEQPVAVAGVMGGATSEVSSTTTRVLLESAYFQPARVRRAARRLGLHSEASHRFERGVDPDGVVAANERCAQLLVERAGARPVGPLIDVYPQPITPRTLSLRPARTRALLGVEVSDEAQLALLRAIGLTVENQAVTWAVTVPTRRPDLTREVDLIEEVARLYGFDRVPATVPGMKVAPGASGDPRADAVREALRGAGLDEVITYAFVSPTALSSFYPEIAPLRLANPLREEQSAMRTTLVPGLLAALQRNVARGQSDVRLFELGHVFLPLGEAARAQREAAGRDGLPPLDERQQVAGVIAGGGDGWLKAGEPLDVFDLKGVVEELLTALGHRAEVTPGQLAFLHPGVQGMLSVGGKIVGWFGEVHPELCRSLGIEANPFAFELGLSSLPVAASPAMTELPRYPAVSRDVSFFIAAEVTAATIAKTIDGLRDPLCVEVRVREDYREAGRVPVGQKGMLWSFTYRASDRTLTDQEVQAAHEAMLKRLGEALSLTLR